MHHGGMAWQAHSIAAHRSHCTGSACRMHGWRSICEYGQLGKPWLDKYPSRYNSLASASCCTMGPYKAVCLRPPCGRWSLDTGDPCSVQASHSTYQSHSCCRCDCRRELGMRLLAMSWCEDTEACCNGGLADNMCGSSLSWHYTPIHHNRDYQRSSSGRSQPGTASCCIVQLRCNTDQRPQPRCIRLLCTASVLHLPVRRGVVQDKSECCNLLFGHSSTTSHLWRGCKRGHSTLSWKCLAYGSFHRGNAWTSNSSGPHSSSCHPQLCK
mmetsp:Transcript_54226/g.126606  ORF Transcript_54226/g.126606 Transcript_54226/m.126606 type:complete len:268 (-) Transcript_54226:5219-6022(-)